MLARTNHLYKVNRVTSDKESQNKFKLQVQLRNICIKIGRAEKLDKKIQASFVCLSNIIMDNKKQSYPQYFSQHVPFKWQGQSFPQPDLQLQGVYCRHG